MVFDFSCDFKMGHNLVLLVFLSTIKYEGIKYERRGRERKGTHDGETSGSFDVIGKRKMRRRRWKKRRKGRKRRKRRWCNLIGLPLIESKPTSSSRFSLLNILLIDAQLSAILFIIDICCLLFSVFVIFHSNLRFWFQLDLTSNDMWINLTSAPKFLTSQSIQWRWFIFSVRLLIRLDYSINSTAIYLIRIESDFVYALIHLVVYNKTYFFLGFFISSICWYWKYPWTCIIYIQVKQLRKLIPLWLELVT